MTRESSNMDRIRFSEVQRADQAEEFNLRLKGSDDVFAATTSIKLINLILIGLSDVYYRNRDTMIR